MTVAGLYAAELKVCRHPINIIMFLVGILNNCLLAGKRYRLPSIAQGVVWSEFHKMHISGHTLQAWNTFISSTIPVEYQKECDLPLQIILDRMLKKY